MKKCPNCQKTFDDNMKFCQSDGTPLVAVADNQPEQDPYATMVANKSDFVIPEEEPKEEAKPVEAPPKPVVEAPNPSKVDDDILEVLDDDEIDPMQTIVASGKNTSDNIKVDLPKEEPKSDPNPPSKPIDNEAKTMMSPEIPKFNEPDIEPPVMTGSIADNKPKVPSPEKPKAPEQAKPAEPKVEEKVEKDTGVPIPSPFEDSMPPGYAPPSTPPFEASSEDLKPEPLNKEVASEPPKTPFAEPEKASDPPKSPFDDMDNSPVNAGSDDPQSPAAPIKEFENNKVVENPPGGSPPEAAGKNQTLAIVSLITGILSMLCCLSIVTGPAGLITGYMARSKAAENPNEYGGETLALVGMITGFVGIIFFIILLALQLMGTLAQGF